MQTLPTVGIARGPAIGSVLGLAIDSLGIYPKISVILGIVWSLTS